MINETSNVQTERIINRVKALINFNCLFLRVVEVKTS